MVSSQIECKQAILDGIFFLISLKFGSKDRLWWLGESRSRNLESVLALNQDLNEAKHFKKQNSVEGKSEEWKGGGQIGMEQRS